MPGRDARPGHLFAQSTASHFIDKAPGLEIVAIVTDLSDYPSIARRTNADWTILLLDLDEDVPEIVQQVLEHQASMRLLMMTIDGSHVRMRWIEPHERSLDGKSLDDLLAILQKSG